MKEKLKAAGWALVFLFGGFGLATLMLPVLRSAAHITPTSTMLEAASVETVALLASYGFFTWLIGSKALHLGLTDLGLAPGAPASRGFGWGILGGAGLAALAMVIAVPLGHAAWRNDGGSTGSWLIRVLLTSCLLLPAALGEELAFRGVPLVALSRRFGRAGALVALSVLFAMGHLGNPEVSGLALVNIGLAGVFLGLTFFSPGGLWTSTGVHFGWNLALAGLAAPVSGIGLPMPWLDYAPGGPRWLTGGGFGPEGGVVATACLLAGCVIARRRSIPDHGEREGVRS